MTDAAVPPAPLTTDTASRPQPSRYRRVLLKVSGEVLMASRASAST
jgi:hypothetical protein